MKRIISIILICLLISCQVYPDSQLKLHNTKSYKLTGKDYFPEVKRLIQEAKKSIYFEMYIATYHPDTPKTPPNQLINELVEAHKRGVKVRIILEQARTYSVKHKYNDLAYFHFKDMGLQVDYDRTATKLHDKLLIIDEETIIIGSHNWSKPALEYNHESSIVTISHELAKEYIEWVETTPIAPRSTTPPLAKSADVYIPFKFMSDSKLGNRLARISEKRLVLYLYLLNKWTDNKNTVIELDYDEAAEFIGVKDRTKRLYRKFINVSLRALQNRYKLLKVETFIDRPAKIELLDYRNKKKKYKPTAVDSFIVPGTLWEFGWIKRLSAKAMYFYFIGLVETKLSQDPKGTWSHSRKHLRKKYHIPQRTQSTAIMELSRYNLLKLNYGQLVFPFDEKLSAIKYTLLPLYSMDWFQNELTSMEELYGKDTVAQAIVWAAVVQEEYNLTVIEKLINYSKEYGKKIVQYAVNKVGKKRIGNPKRSFLYIEGIILKDWRDKHEKE